MGKWARDEDAPGGDDESNVGQGAFDEDEALLDIARVLGVGEIWSEAYDESGYPTEEHEIWGILRRRLDRKAVGESVANVYLVLDQLGLPTRVASAQQGQTSGMLEVVSLGDASPVYALEVSSSHDPRLVAVIDENRKEPPGIRRFSSSSNVIHRQSAPRTVAPPRLSATRWTHNAPVFS